MKFNNYLEECQDDDVLCNQQSLFKVGKVKNVIISAFNAVIPDKLQEELARQKLHIQPTRWVDNGRGKKVINQNNNVWFEEGVDFQILRAGSKGWEKGKLKINVTLEFIPDEPEEKSPLDRVRQELNRDNF